jgi:hypothetical protein
MLNEKETSSWNARSMKCQPHDENLGVKDDPKALA